MLTMLFLRDRILALYADVVELVDSVDLGSSVFDVQVRVLSSAPYRVFITDLTVVDTRFFIATISSCGFSEL